jgi:hypothetical protein
MTFDQKTLNLLIPSKTSSFVLEISSTPCRKLVYIQGLCLDESFDGSPVLIVGNPQGILGQQLRPQLIH